MHATQRNTTMEKCYMCESEGNTVEHAPPKCLFPEKKDLDSSVDLRKELITVPSCEIHNTSKSKDDEYLLYVLSVSITNNQTGLKQFLTKVKRSYERNPSIIKRITEKQVPVTVVKTIDGSTENTIAIQIERDRVESALEHTARALYRHETGENFKGEVLVAPGFLLDINNAELNKQAEALRGNIEKLTFTIEAKGKNPEVFTYKAHIDKINGTIIEMNFYGQTKAFAIMKHLVEQDVKNVL